MQKINNASSVLLPLLGGIVFVLSCLAEPVTVLGQQHGPLAGVGGIFGVGQGIGAQREETRDRRRPSMRVPQQNQRDEGGLISREEAEKMAAEEAVREARDLILEARRQNPALAANRSFRRVEETVGEAETALQGRNFTVAIEKATIATRAITELVPALRPEVLTDDDFILPEDEISSIEAAFSREDVAPEVSRDLRQFGYDIFGTPASTFAPVLDVPVGPDYTLGPDDTLIIRLWGLVDEDIQVTVDREGKIFLPKIGSISVWGLNFRDAKALIQKRLARYYRKFQADITFGRLRTIKVYVLGDVMLPGGYSLSSLSKVTNALYAARGPKKTGSMRHIKLIRNGKTIGVIDLYDYLLQGSNRNDLALQSGDTVFVPPIGPVVGVAGHVKRPAIYELKGTVTLADGLRMAGGVSPMAYLQRVQVERIAQHKEKVLLDVDVTRAAAGNDRSRSLRLQDGDFIKVLPIYARAYESVTLEGFVRHPGQYELKPGMRLSDIVTVDEIVPETNLDYGEIVRVDNETLRHEVMVFVPRLLFQADRSQDTRLKPEDTITLFSEFKNPDKVSLGGEFKRPGIYTIEPGELLSSVIRRAGGFTEEAYPKAGVFLRESIEERQREQMTRMASIQTQRMAVEQAALAAGAVATGVSAGESSAATAQAIKGEETVLQEAQAQVQLGRLVVNVGDPDVLAGTPDDVLLQNGDSLHIPQTPVSVAVLGSVRNPTALLHSEGELFPYYIQRSGGFTEDADLDEMYILRVNGDSVSESMKRYILERGDAIIVPPKIEARIQPLPFWTSILSIVGNTAIGLSAMFLLF